jgi:hypothetical protein
MYQMDAVQAETFDNLWEAAQDQCRDHYHEFRALAQTIRPGLSDQQFDHAWQHCNCTHPNKQQARIDFMMLVNQTF